MTINETMLHRISELYFDSKEIPQDLLQYFTESYGEAPDPEDMPLQYLWPFVESDVRDYLAGRLEVDKRTDLEKANDQVDELADLYTAERDENERLNEEIRYLREFITWMHLDWNYEQFRRNAHEDPDRDGLPFPNLVM